MVITPRVEVTTGEEGQIRPYPREFFPWSPVEAADLSALDVLMQAGRPPPSAHIGSQEVSTNEAGESSAQAWRRVACEWDDKMLQQGTI